MSRAAKIDGREPIAIHPSAAAARGLTDGDIARVFNRRGSLLAGVVLDEALRSDVVQMATGAWFEPVDFDGHVMCRHGNVNILTHDHGTSSLAQGPAAQSCLVEIERYDGPPMPVHAFRPPDLIARPR